MIPLEQIKVASPCSASWEAMTGTEQVRHCESCRKNVYNLSEMTQTEAERLITRMEGRLCVRYYTRSDGTILTQDCPTGLRAVRKRLAARLSYAAALLLTGWIGLLRLDHRAEAVQLSPASGGTHETAAQNPQAVTPSSPPQTRAMMGDMAVSPPVARTGQATIPAPPPAAIMGAPLPVVMPPPDHIMGRPDHIMDKIAIRPHHSPAKPPRVKRPGKGKTRP